MNDLATSTSTALADPRTTSWELLNRQAKAYSASDMVPQQYRGNVANCIVALEMSHRMNASPLMVMQNLYIVHGNPGWSSKFLIACFNQCGRFSSLRYEWNDARSACRAWAVERATNDRIDGPQVSVEMAKAEGWSTKNGSKWKSMPELMLMYRAAAFLIRTYAPEISMGLQTAEELADVYDAPPEPGKKKSVTLADLVETPAPEDAVETTLDTEAGEVAGPSYAQLVDKLKATTSADAAAIVLDSARHLPADQRQELASMVDNMAWST